MRIGIGIAAGAACLLSGCMAPPLLMGAASMGALGGQTVLTRKLGKNAGNRAARKVETAMAIGNDIDSSAIKISNLDMRGDTESWTADTPDGRYACSQKKGHTTVSCVKDGSLPQPAPRSLRK